MAKWIINICVDFSKSATDPKTHGERDIEMEIEAPTGPQAVIIAMQNIELEAGELLHEIEGVPYVHISRPRT